MPLLPGAVGEVMLIEWRRRPYKEGVLRDEEDSQQGEHTEAPHQAPGLGVHGHAHSNYCQVDKGEDVNGEEGCQEQRSHRHIHAPILP